ncbi:MAG: polyprenyl synthetase family protein [Polyangiaceae bacterium]|nr:polyprenyl synthetase family protein [Polyangiaceae bacterium]
MTRTSAAKARVAATRNPGAKPRKERRPPPATPKQPPRPKPHAKPIPANPFSTLAAHVKGDVDARLVRLLDQKVAKAREIGTEFVELVSAVRDLCLRGGKRLRPALLVAGYRAVSARGSIDPALDAGVALELLQSYFLIHDDWMDGDTVRRGGPAVHTLLGERFGSCALGDRAGVLAGDYAAALAAEAIAGVDVPPARLARVWTAFAEMQLDVVAGQQLDLVAKSASVETVYTLKTSAYTVRGPLRLGVLLGGASQRVLDVIDRFSYPIGIAFQLRDDLLGAFGDPTETGKPLGTDLKTGKRTLLLELALKRARGRDHRILRDVVGNAKASLQRTTAALEVLHRTGAREVVEARIDELSATALAALASGPLTADGRALLVGAASVLTARRS